MGGEEVPVRFSSSNLKSRGKTLGRAALMRDLRDFKKLELEKLEAERLAAVGQTVAGLAHSIKNLLMGLEGGMYIVDGGLRRGDASRIAEGWQILQRNFEKTTSMVKDFLSFAKGRLPELKPSDPNAIARAIHALYRDAAARQGVELSLEAGEDVREAPLDPDAIETCLTNLVSNGIDAAVLREEPGGQGSDSYAGTRPATWCSRSPITDAVWTRRSKPRSSPPFSRLKAAKARGWGF